MNILNRKTRNITGIVTVAMIFVSYLLVRFVLFDLHGMKEWPNYLAILSISFIVGASILKKKKVFIGVVFGYIVGFAVALIFNTSSVDATGGATNNTWLIWSVFLLVSTFVSLLISYRKKPII